MSFAQKEVNKVKKDLRDVSQQFETTIIKLANDRKAHSCDAETCHLIGVDRIKKTLLINEIANVCTIINQQNQTNARITFWEGFTKSVKKFLQDTCGLFKDPNEQENKFDIDEIFKKSLEENNIKQNPDGTYELTNKFYNESFYKNLMLTSAESVKDYMYLINHFLRIWNIKFEREYFSLGPTVLMTLKEKEKNEPGVVEYLKEEICFSISQEKGSKISQFFVEVKESSLTETIVITGRGTFLDSTLTCLSKDEDENRFCATVDKNNLKSFEKYDNIDLRRYNKTDFSSESALREELVVARPSNEIILRKYFRIKNKSMEILSNCFIVIREVIQLCGEKKKFFFDAVTVTITDGNSKVESDIVLSTDIDYKVRIFFLDMGQDKTYRIRMVLADCQKIYECITQIKMYIFPQIKAELADDLTSDFFRMNCCYDRRIAIKINLDDKLEIAKIKEYQTRHKLKEQLLRMKKIVLKETNGVRFSWTREEEELRQLEEKKNSKKKKTKKKASTKSKGQSKKQDSNAKTARVLDPEKTFNFFNDFSYQDKGLYHEKVIRYNMESKIDIEELIKEPNLNRIVEFMRQDYPEGFKTRNSLKNKPLKLNFCIQIDTETEITDNYGNITKEEGYQVTVLTKNVIQQVTPTSELPNWKIKGAEMKRGFINVSNYFQVSKDKTCIEHYSHPSLYIIQEFYHLTAKFFEKEIIQNAVIFDILHGPLYFSEIKCQLKADLDIKQAGFLNHSTFFTEEPWQILGDVSKDFSEAKVYFDNPVVEVRENQIFRETIKIIPHYTYMLRAKVTEPNLTSVLLHLYNETKNIDKILTDAPQGRFSPGIVKRMDNDLIAYTPSPHDHSKFCVESSNFSRFLILSQVEISVIPMQSALQNPEEEKVLEKYYTPKIVQLKCPICQPSLLNLVDGDQDQACFLRKNETIGIFDLLVALDKLENECFESGSPAEIELAKAKYKQRIQRITQEIL